MVSMGWLLRHRRTKVAVTDRPIPNDVGACPLLYPELCPPNYAHLKKQFWGRHIWARGYLAVSSGNITDEAIQKYIDEQDGEPVQDESRFQIDPQ
jgi:putative transposase